MDENKKPEQISYYEHEAEIAREEAHVQRADRHFKIACTACLIVFIAFVASNGWWIWHSSKTDKIVTTVTQDATAEGGGAAIIYGDRSGAVFYGDSEAADYPDESEEEEETK